MRTWLLKLRLIFLPFLIIGISFVSLYTLINWLLFVKFELFSIRDIVRHFGLPVFLLIFPLVKWIKPRINLLAFKPGSKDRPLITLLLAGVAIFFPTFIAQEYMTTATGKLTPLEGINSINKLEKTKYYTVKNYYVSKNDIGMYGSSEVTGSKNENLRVSIYIVLPIYESIVESRKKNPMAWLGIKYTDSIKNNLSKAEKDGRIDDFFTKSQTDFESKDVQNFIYLDRIGSSDNLDGYKKALETSSKFKLDNDIILVPIHTAFEVRNGSKFAWIFLSFALGAFFWLLLISKAKFNEDALAKLLNSKTEKQTNELYDLISTFLIPTKDFFVTPILIDLNIFIFLLLFTQGHGFMSVKSDALMLWGANYGPSIANGEYWRLFSSTFLHIGIIHLAGNIFGLTLVGPILEPILGKVKFAFAYAATGVIASLTSIYWHDAAISVGASGAIFGLCGVLLALCATNVLHDYFDTELSSSLMSIIGVFVVCNLIMGFTGNIDNAAHIGGLLSGCVLGLLQSIVFRLKSTQRQKN